AAFITAASQTTDKEQHYQSLRQAFLEKIMAYPELFTIYQTSLSQKQLPQIIGLGVKNVEGQLIMLELNRLGFAISTGSACQVGQQHTSKAMMALQIDAQQAKEFIRISFGNRTTMASVHTLADHLIGIAVNYA